MLAPPVLSQPRPTGIDAQRHAARRPAGRLRAIAVQVCAAAVLVLGAPAATAWAAAAATPAPPVAPALTSTGDPGVTQQKAIGIVAGETLVLLDAAGHTAPASGVTVAGQGTYVLNGSAVLWFEPLPASRGTAHSLRYRL